jgi:hypothetical protein
VGDDERVIRNKEIGGEVFFPPFYLYKCRKICIFAEKLERKNGRRTNNESGTAQTAGTDETKGG